MFRRCGWQHKFQTELFSLYLNTTETFFTAFRPFFSDRFVGTNVNGRRKSFSLVRGSRGRNFAVMAGRTMGRGLLAFTAALALTVMSGVQANTRNDDDGCAGHYWSVGRQCEGFLRCGDTVTGDTSIGVDVAGGEANDAFYVVYLSYSYEDQIEFSTCGSSFDTYLHLYKIPASDGDRTDDTDDGQINTDDHISTWEEITTCDDCGSCQNTRADLVTRLEGGWYMLQVVPCDCSPRRPALTCC